MPIPIDSGVPGQQPGKILSLSIPTDFLSGAGAGGAGLTLNYNFGPNADTIAQNAYGFVGSQIAGATAFEGNAIKGTQDFLSNQVTPITNVVAAEQGSFFKQIIDAFTQTQAAQVNLGQAGISAENQVANASIRSSNKSRKGGSLLGAIFGGGCFITTAVCKYSGLPDDCDTLQTLRRWRDTWMQETAERRALVEAYYRDAPGYVAKIDALPEKMKHGVYARLRADIETVEYAIACGQNELALVFYLAAVEFARASSEYLK